MGPIENNLTGVLGAMLIVSIGYAIGRIHQWSRDGQSRDAGFRLGYDQAAAKIFQLMPGMRPKDNPTGTVTSKRVGSRHSVEERNAGTVRVRRPE